MANKILLTGAGFTHNFGAPLASEVSGLIFNAVTSTRLQDLLRENFDYEDIYQNVLQSSDYSDQLKSELTSAIKSAYDVIDELITTGHMSEKINIIKFKEFLKWFDKTSNGGFIFTLNQDLLIENNLNKQFCDMSLKLPIQSKTVDKSNSHVNPLADRKFNYIILDEDVEISRETFSKQFEKNQSNIFYIKLHGSQNWYKDDDTQMMIIGHGKGGRIHADPLLSWYFDIIKRQLNQTDTRLLIIGYSFSDEHINQEIYNSRDSLKIFIINPQPFKDFSLSLKDKPFGSQILSLINKYYSISLPEMFGRGINDPHPFWGQLKSEFNKN